MNKDFIRISQYNIEGAMNKKPLFIKYLYDNDIDICLLNETWLRDKNTFNIPSYNFVYQNGKDGRCGVGILVKNHLKYTVSPTPFYEFLQTTAIILSTNAGNLTLLCAYSPPTNNNQRRFQGRRLKQILNDLPKPIMLSGDLNAHHVAFGCLSTNSRGSEIYNIIDEYDLCILNTGTPTTVGSPNKNPSAIDISCISPSLASLCHWRVHDDSMGSYHFPTIIDIQTSVHKYEIGSPIDRFVYSKADWLKFLSETEHKLGDLVINHSCPLESYNEFCNKLNEIKEICIPKFKKTTQFILKKPVPWWDTECSEAVQKSKEALNLYRSNSSIDSYIQYKKLDALKKKLLAEKKKNGWSKLCESFNRYTPVSTIWNYIRRFKRVALPKTPKNDEWIPSFLDKYAPQSPPEKQIDEASLNKYFYRNNYDSNDFLSQPFSFNEFLAAIKTRKDTSPGLDDIPYKLIRHMHITAQKTLLNIFNLLWISNSIPDTWKTQCVIPILKQDKPENDFNSYRPIALSSCVGKLFEFMLKTRLDHFVETNKILPEQQFGFRKGRSAAESFTSLVEDIKNSFHGHSATVCAFLDVQGAFDNVNPSVLIQILSEIGIPGHICKWIFNFLYNRTMYVKFNNNIHGPGHVYKGTMQGATISPLLYNIYTSQINKYLTLTNVKFLQFADDLLIYTVNRNVNIAVNNLNDALEQVHSFYFGKLKLNISPNKSGVMLFSKKHTICNSRVIYNNCPLPWLEDKKFLGIWLDQRLTFQPHINYIIKNACKGLNILKSLAGVHWGSDPKILSMLYKSIVRSHFDYSSLAYMNANITTLKKLDIIQNKALRIISGAMCSTPINAMQCETCIPPLHFRRFQIAERFCLKIIASDNSCVLNRILPTQHNISFNSLGPYLNRSQLLLGNIPELLRTIIHLKSITVNMYKDSLWPFYRHGYNIHFNSIIVNKQNFNSQAELLQFLDTNNLYSLYTDGSKSADRVTSAFYDPQNKSTKCFKLDSKCSIFTAESYAIYQALLYVKNIVFKNFIIFSDSLSVLTALKNNCSKYSVNYLVINIKNVINDLYNTGKTIEFVWVPSHRGFTGNEIVDQATRNEHNEDHSTDLKIPFTDYHSQLKHKMKLLWHDYWKETSKEKGRWYADIQGSPPAQPWYHRNKTADCRKFITTINRMRFGHCQTRTHLKRLNLVQDSKCTFCEEDNADLNHIVFNCQSFGVHRLILVTELQSVCDDDEVPTRLQDLLADQKFYAPLYKYIINTINKL
ncbi:hypothetical protein JYU34_003863 [Plutella xylostella]|uniref:Uncharacterized protein n=1 Tax=Plutella xylostella TaxID=51655 RepID=A0ABQ7R156_PLUXY|nr:hypothetical protein JYU34_003863 [Plutella xylostella]